MATNANTSLTDWDEGSLTLTLISLRTALEPEEMQVFTETVAAFLTVLLQYERWSGSQQTAQECVRLLIGHTPPERLVPTPVPPDEQRAALLALPIVDDLARLLRWIGPGRPVTTTGAIRLADLPDAAAVFGWRVHTGKRHAVEDSGSNSQLSIALDDEAAGDHTADPGIGLPADAPQQHGVKSMWELMAVALPWHTLARCELITIGKTRATPIDRAAHFSSDADLTQLATAVATYLHGWLTQMYESDSSPTVICGGVVHGVMRSCIEGDPVTGEEVTAHVRRVCAEYGLTDYLAPHVTQNVFDSLTWWCQRGLLVETPDGFVVPDPVQSTVATALTLVESGP